MLIRTSNTDSIRSYLDKLYIPRKNSHKGQNGKVLVVGGSSLFHSASIWAAEIASYFVDIVFYSSIASNNVIMQEDKKKFRNGIVVSRGDLEDYVQEADSILIGPGMMRGGVKNFQFDVFNFQNVLKVVDEPSQTFYLTKYLLEKYPHKQFVLDAGALQMMNKDLLPKLKTPAILAPHHGEFAGLFGNAPVTDCARVYKCILLYKSIEDVVTNGKKTVTIQGGNQGLTKGGTGDILAGLTVALSAKGDPFAAAVVASFLLKKTADTLFTKQKYWYNISSLIKEIPKSFAKLISV